MGNGAYGTDRGPQLLLTNAKKTFSATTDHMGPAKHCLMKRAFSTRATEPFLMALPVIASFL